MEQLKRELADAFHRAARYRRTVVLLSQLNADAEAVRRRQKEFESLMAREIAGADKLEAGGVSVAFSRLIGTHQEQQDRAREERYAAKRRCEDASRAIEELDRYIADVQSECAMLSGSEEAYEALYNQRMQWLRENDVETQQRLDELAGLIEEVTLTIRRISEAKVIGRRIAEYLDAAYRSLEEPDGYFRSSLMVRIDAADTADTYVQDAGKEAEKFNAIMDAISVMPGRDRNITMRFVDISFSGLVPNWTPLKRVERSMENIEKAKSDVHATLTLLAGIAQSEEMRLRSLEDERLVLLMGA